MSHIPIAGALLPLERPAPTVALWRWVVEAFRARRQRQADRLILRSLHRYDSRLEDDFRLQLERRLMGQ